MAVAVTVEVGVGTALEVACVGEGKVTVDGDWVELAGAAPLFMANSRIPPTTSSAATTTAARTMATLLPDPPEDVLEFGGGGVRGVAAAPVATAAPGVTVGDSPAGPADCPPVAAESTWAPQAEQNWPPVVSAPQLLQ
ncbi:MAG: hypothetical protein E6Q90_01235 [Actinobacteria bacterium]|nr:MAG: hypothetical protein E6Q90_01235 [Actinomycetota bacterium]